MSTIEQNKNYYCAEGINAGNFMKWKNVTILPLYYVNNSLLPIYLLEVIEPLILSFFAGIQILQLHGILIGVRFTLHRKIARNWKFLSIRTG